MNRWVPGAFALLSAGFVAVALAQSIRVRRMTAELEETRARLEKIEARQREAASASRAAVEEVRGEIQRVESEARSRKADLPGARPGALPTLLTEEDIQKVVDERMEARLQAQGGARGERRGGGGDRKMPLHDLGKELGLDERAQLRLAEIANAAKKDIFQILRTPRPDGTNVADELIDAMLKGEPAVAQQLFARLMTDKVPGSDTPYLTAVSNIRQKAGQEIEKALGPETFTRFKHMNLKPENIETGYDPLGEYFAQRGK